MAAEFVLGTLNRAMLLQFREELTHNPALREAVKDWERRLGMERTSVTLHPRPQDHPKTPAPPKGSEDRKNGSGPADAGEQEALSAFDLALGARARCGPREAAAHGEKAAKAPTAPDSKRADQGAISELKSPEPAPAAPEPSPTSDPKAVAESETQVTDRQEPPVLRADEGEWESLAPRVYKKLLSRDDSFNRQSYLLRMIPGGRIQPQRRGGIEEIYVLEGRLTIGENTLGPGDFHAFPAKSFVPEIAAGGDSLILVRGHIAERIPDPKGTA